MFTIAVMLMLGVASPGGTYWRSGLSSWCDGVIIWGTACAIEVRQTTARHDSSLLAYAPVILHYGNTSSVRRSRFFAAAQARIVEVTP